MIRAFIQARMSSTRFPGKVLAPLRGRPVIDHVIERVARVVPQDRIVVATSEATSDDALADHFRNRGTALFRGALENVFARFSACLKEHPCDWFFRISADSPLLQEDIINRVMNHPEREGADLVTNVFPRTFPRGHSVELLRADTFAGIDPDTLNEDEREHATLVYYKHPSDYRIVNLVSEDQRRAKLNFCVDTPEDLPRIEALMNEVSA